MNKKVNVKLVDSVMEKLEKKKINISTASVLLGVTERQVYKIKKKKAEGPLDVKSKPKKLPSNRTDQQTIDIVIELYMTKYKGFSYVHFTEKLFIEENININLKTVERILKKAYLISPFANKKTKQITKKILQSMNQATTPDMMIEQNPLLDDNIIFVPRDIHNRHRHVENFGEIIQMDARTDFYIEEEKWTLHLAIDISSGKFVGAYFDVQETLKGYQHVLYQIVTKYGIPKCILADNRTVFEYLKKGSNQESKNTLIQFKYSCIQLGIKLNTTSVATYKSIIERANGTLGRRAPQELQLKKIKNIDVANLFLTVLLDELNGKFSYPYSGINVFKKAPDLETINNCIGNISRRVFDKGCTVRFMNKYYYATAHNKIVAFMAGVKCLIVRTFDNRKIIVVDSVSYDAICIDDYEFSPEKEANPDNELFISKHRVNSVELCNYKEKHISSWDYSSFTKYVEKELEYIESNY